MTENEAKGFAVGSKVKALVSAGTTKAGDLLEVVGAFPWNSHGEWCVKTLNSRSEHNWWRKLTSLEKENTVNSWFDERLAEKPRKPEWEPDKGIDWEKHKQFMKAL